MSVNLNRSVLIMAGGTGGHVFPALAAADCLRQQGINVEWLGTRSGIEQRLVPAAGIPIHYIMASGLRGKNIFKMLKSLFNLVGATYQALRVLVKLKPVCVLGMGGFVSAPGGLAAWITGKPLVIHEQNAVAGSANRLLATIARRVLTGYPIDLGGDKNLFIGNPVRRAITEIAKPEERYKNTGRLKLLVVGGSLGAKPINDVLPQALTLLDEESRPQVWHQTGSLHVERVANEYRSVNIEVNTEAFIENMAEAYAWADVVLCRAGALTVAEIMAVGVASILVPLPYAIDDHQSENARWLSDNNAGVLMPQSSMTAETLAQMLKDFNDSRDQLLSMAITARGLAKTDAAETVASVCLELASD
jgi:UDP-N-acetylglucosamine--N-acetylmuramyl-(pentapeptide) pyrophosphoryl-undecaprenol N-acetylglucosamine transferase